MSRASLAELEAVATVARAGGFRAAARELGVSSSALSHAIAALEDRLHVRLFNRTTRSVALTAAGEIFVAEVAPALAVIDGALENASEGSSEILGVLRYLVVRSAARRGDGGLCQARHRRSGQPLHDTTGGQRGID